MVFKTRKKNQSQRRIFGKSSFWNNSCIWCVVTSFFFFSVWNFGNLPTQLSTTKKNGPAHEHLHLLLNGCFLFQANVQVLLGFSFGQSSPSPWSSQEFVVDEILPAETNYKMEVFVGPNCKNVCFFLVQKESQGFWACVALNFEKQDLASTLKIVFMPEMYETL